MLDLVYNLKVKDVMSRELRTVGPGTPMREAQRVMKEQNVTGLPVAEDGELLGIVSMQDVLTALEEGRISQDARSFMSRKLIVLEEDMPISFAVTYFEKYTFNRFPVLNSANRLVGIVTSRDIISRLLIEANLELERIERSRQSGSPPLPGSVEREFAVFHHDFENAGYASTEIKKLLKQKNVDSKTARRIAIAAYELEMNLVVHSEGGRIRFSFDGERAVVEADDEGPGIEDVEKAQEEGYTTAGEWIRSLGFGAGMGLPNVKRVSDEFRLGSSAEGGTHARAVMYLDRSPAEENREGENR
jgi:CBS domain-containing protein